MTGKWSGVGRELVGPGQGVPICSLYAACILCICVGLPTLVVFPLLFGSPHDLRGVYLEDRCERLTGGLEVGVKDR